ncbi:ABC transporter substrate-binding protein [Pseudonocardia nematodicida]|uniref:ABC transporter substrate-binding protein n=1 Tax=Pseudonocardia nematodicida TaxID=1206997 RepID=A0ABV1K6C5_9PSEU
MSTTTSRRNFLRTGGLVAAGMALGPALLTGCGATGRDGPLTVWWGRGYYEEEDLSATRMVEAWSEMTGREVSIQFLSTPAMASKLTSSVEAGRPPDLAYHQNVRGSLFAHQGKLADVTDVVDSLALTPQAREAVRFRDDVRDVTSYFAVPLLSWTIPIFHWRSMLTDVGLDFADAPRDWDGYWNFWKDAQARAAAQPGSGNPYGVGWSLSSAMEDTPEFFQVLLKSTGAELLDGRNEIDVDGAGVREGLEYTLRWITELYADGYTPPDSISWQSGGNNQVFHNNQVFMTPNGTLSIPGSIKDKDPERWADIVTTPWPDAPVGGPTPAPVKFGRILCFEEAGRVDETKDLLSFIMREQNVQQYLEDGRGRWYPTMSSLVELPFWADNPDANVRAVHRIFDGGTIQPDWRELSLGYSRVEDLNIWATALTRVLIEGRSVEDTTADTLRQIELLGEQFNTRT